MKQLGIASWRIMLNRNALDILGTSVKHLNTNSSIIFYNLPSTCKVFHPLVIFSPFKSFFSYLVHITLGHPPSSSKLILPGSRSFRPCLVPWRCYSFVAPPSEKCLAHWPHVHVELHGPRNQGLRCRCSENWSDMIWLKVHLRSDWSELMTTLW